MTQYRAKLLGGPWDGREHTVHADCNVIDVYPYPPPLHIEIVERVSDEERKALIADSLAASGACCLRTLKTYRTHRYRRGPFNVETRTALYEHEGVAS